MVILWKRRPDVVVSGINRGANLGQDIYYSGTVAAAREATFHGIPSIAVSSVVDFTNENEEKHFQTAADFILKILDQNIHLNLRKFELLNVNVPNIPMKEVEGYKLTTLGFRKYSENISKREDFRNRPYYWIGGVYQGHMNLEDSDCQAIDDNKISLTPINLLENFADRDVNWSDIIEKLNES